MKSDQSSTPDALRSAFLADFLGEINAAKPAPDDPSIIVYLYTGSIEEIRPATSVLITGESIVLLYGAAPVARYPRREVSFCSKALVSPFPS